MTQRQQIINFTSVQDLEDIYADDLFSLDLTQLKNSNKTQDNRAFHDRHLIVHASSTLLRNLLQSFSSLILSWPEPCLLPPIHAPRVRTALNLDPVPSEDQQ